MKEPARLITQVTLSVSAIFFAVALQTYAFTEPSSTPPAGDAYAPINTGPDAQDKNDAASHGAWITTDGIGSRYGAQLATLSGSLVVGVAKDTPAGTLDVDTAAHAATICLNGSCINDWSQVSGGGYVPTDVTLIGGKTSAQCTDAGGTVASVGGGQYVCKKSGTSCPSGWSKYRNWTTTSPNSCGGGGGGSCGGPFGSASCSYGMCTTQSHAFSDASAETCTFAYSSPQLTGGNELYCGCSQTQYDRCAAYTTEVGCV